MHISGECLAYILLRKELDVEHQQCWGVSDSCACCPKGRVLPLLWAFLLSLPTEQSVFQSQLPALSAVTSSSSRWAGKGKEVSIKFTVLILHPQLWGWCSALDTKIIPQAGGDSLSLQAVSTSRHLRRHPLHGWGKVPPCLALGLSTGQAGGNSILAKSARASLHLMRAMRTESSHRAESIPGLRHLVWKCQTL